MSLPTINADQVKHARTVARIAAAIAAAYAFHLETDDAPTERTGRAAMRRIGAMVLSHIVAKVSKAPFHNMDGMLRWIEQNKQASVAVLAVIDAGKRPSDLIGACTVEAWRHVHACIVRDCQTVQELRKVETAPPAVHTCAEPVQA